MRYLRLFLLIAAALAFLLSSCNTENSGQTDIPGHENISESETKDPNENGTPSDSNPNENGTPSDSNPNEDPDPTPGEKVYYTLEDFDAIIVWESTLDDLYAVMPWKTMEEAEGDVYCEYPMENGGCIRVTFYNSSTEGTLVSAIYEIPPPAVEEVRYYRMEEFASVIVGESTLADISRVAPSASFEYKSYGRQYKLPRENGGYIYVRLIGSDYDAYVVSHLEEVLPGQNQRSDFDPIKVGRSTIEDVRFIAPEVEMIETSYGGYCECPTSDGGYTRITFYGEELIVSSKEAFLPSQDGDEEGDASDSPQEGYYERKDFASIKVGESLWEDVCALVPSSKFVHDDSSKSEKYRGYCRYPTQNGGYIHMDFYELCEGKLVVARINEVAPAKQYYTEEDFASFVLGDSTVYEVYGKAPCYVIGTAGRAPIVFWYPMQGDRELAVFFDSNGVYVTMGIQSPAMITQSSEVPS